MKFALPDGEAFLNETFICYVSDCREILDPLKEWISLYKNRKNTPVIKELRPVVIDAGSPPTYQIKTLTQVHQQQLPEVKVPVEIYAEEDTAASDQHAAEHVQTQGDSALPQAVQTFLDAQALYAESLPANVSYEMPSLPFDYTTPVSGYHSSGFGYRVHPVYQDVRFHYGTDFAAYSGEMICAFADGTVTVAAYNESYGNYIVIAHADGWQSLYAHCSKLMVNSGETVTRGEKIALVGATGLATGPHLHFELSCDGTYANPEYYI